MAGNVCAASKITLITHLCRIHTHFSGLRMYFLCTKNFVVDDLSQKCHFAGAGLE